MRCLNPLVYNPVENKALAAVILALAGLCFGAGLTDLLDDPAARAAFLDDGGVRSMVEERWWAWGLAGLFFYAVRLDVPFRARQTPRTVTWWSLIELLAVLMLACLTALGLSWMSVQFIPCTLESRC